MKALKIFADINAQFCYVFSKEYIETMLTTISETGNEDLKTLFCQIVCSCDCADDITTTTTTTTTSTTTTTEAPGPCEGGSSAWLTITSPLNPAIISLEVEIQDTLNSNAVVYNNTFNTFPVNFSQSGLFPASPSTDRYAVYLTLITPTGNERAVTAQVQDCDDLDNFYAQNFGSLINTLTGTFKTDINVSITV